MVEVDGDEGQVAIAKNTLHWAFGGCLEGCVDVFGGGFFAQIGNEVNDRDVGGWHADGHAVHFAFELGHDKADCLGGAGLGGDHAEGGSAGAAKIAVLEIEDALVVRVGVNRGD